MALQKEQHHAANRDGQRQAEEQTAIVHYDDAEDGEMTEDRAGHNGEREPGAEPCGRRKQNQNCRDQFGNAGTNPSPRFQADTREDINGLRRAGEFEKQGLQKNYRRDDTQSPGEDGFDFGIGSHRELLLRLVAGSFESLQLRVVAGGGRRSRFLGFTHT
jgi:hypothetical protein